MKVFKHTNSTDFYIVYPTNLVSAIWTNSIYTQQRRLYVATGSYNQSCEETLAQLRYDSHIEEIEDLNHLYTLLEHQT